MKDLLEGFKLFWGTEPLMCVVFVTALIAAIVALAQETHWLAYYGH